MRQLDRWTQFGQSSGSTWLRALVVPSYYRAVLRSGIAGSWGLGGWAIVTLTATSSQAQQVVPLPPPPTVSVPGLSSPNSLNSTPLPGSETVFLAPVNRSGATLGQYTVYVNGDSPYLLQQVRAIEPSASVQRYQGQSVIQAGTFDNEASARRQITALNSQGIMAELATNAAVNATPSSSAPTSRYVVVIPGSQNDLPGLADRVIRMGIRQEAVQEKSAPFGPHLEIGPFAQHSDAKKISQFLNGGGLDSLVYYNR
ncbi:MAG: hypothetical protein KME45_06895 [Stenomitos rutilans HA7619-LM2]|nr:hypothetical protein [Stenomitos rutilans HA7619-LM2]